MKLSKTQTELLELLKKHKKMEWCFYGKSPTQFKIKTAESLEKKGLVRLEYLGSKENIQYRLTEV